MPESFYDIIVLLFFTVVPVTLILIHAFLSSRKKMVGAIIIPLLWSSFGAWMIIARYHQGSEFAKELLYFYLGGDFILFGITALVRYMKKKKRK